ncbi:MAG: hypothetical protein ACE5JQ_16560, partial [Candidatus Methylomirabilales bacterium]
MFEVLERSGLARRGLLHAEEGVVRTPNLLLGVKPDAGSWLEELIHGEEGLEALLLAAASGAGEDGPPILSRPLSLSDLEMPVQEETGPVAFLPGPSVAEKTTQDIVALQNTVEFLRYPRRFARSMADLRREAGYQRAIYTPLIAT